MDGLGGKVGYKCVGRWESEVRVEGPARKAEGWDEGGWGKSKWARWDVG